MPGFARDDSDLVQRLRQGYNREAGEYRPYDNLNIYHTGVLYYRRPWLAIASTHLEFNSRLSRPGICLEVRFRVDPSTIPL